MSIYDKSSLVLIPSGTKTGKVFSQKPVSGDGDFTFTRASAATRVNADGNIEKETGNLLLQSNSFNTTWIPDRVSVSAGQQGYNNSNAAWLLIPNTPFTYHTLKQTISNTGVMTFSVYAKAQTYDGVFLYNGDAGNGKFFNLVNGTLGSDFGGGVINASIEAVGNDWYRCSIAVNKTASGSFEILVSEDGESVYSFAGDGVGGVYIQDAQVNQGLIAQEVITTTTTAVYGGITDNTPRLDYTDSSCPALLLEPLRTNLITQSEYFESSFWNKGNVSVVTNTTTSPEGLVNAIKLVEDTSTGSHRIYPNIIVDSQKHAFSVFVKKETRNWISLRLDGLASDQRTWFDLENGVIGTKSADHNAEIVSLSDGWYRCSVSIKGTTYQPAYPILGIADADNSSSYTGDGTSGIYIFGAQVEAGSYKTSYIPTYGGSSVTRVADSCVKTGISSLIGQTEGTALLDIISDDIGGNVALRLSDGTNSNRVNFEWAGSKVPYLVVQSGGSLVVYQSVTCSQNVRHKIAIGYKANDFVIYIDGVLAASDTSGAVPTSLTQIEFGEGSSKFMGKYNKFTLFKERLTNAE